MTPENTPPPPEAKKETLPSDAEFRAKPVPTPAGFKYRLEVRRILGFGRTTAWIKVDGVPLMDKASADTALATIRDAKEPENAPKPHPDAEAMELFLTAGRMIDQQRKEAGHTVTGRLSANTPQRNVAPRALMETNYSAVEMRVAAAADLGRCGTCQEKLGDHHKKSCAHWGQVLPSECPGYLDSIVNGLKEDGALKFTDREKAAREFKEAYDNVSYCVVEQAVSEAYSKRSAKGVLAALPGNGILTVNPEPPPENTLPEYCPKRDDGTHCEHWWDGDKPCCNCGDNSYPVDEDGKPRPIAQAAPPKTTEG